MAITLYSEGPVIRYGVIGRMTSKVTRSLLKNCILGTLLDEINKEFSTYSMLFMEAGSVEIIPGVNGINPYGSQGTLWYRGPNLASVTLAKLNAAKECKKLRIHFGFIWKTRLQSALMVLLNWKTSLHCVVMEY